ncbi:unnamed protein product [Choristocarpus tenellus]
MQQGKKTQRNVPGKTKLCTQYALMREDLGEQVDRALSHFDEAVRTGTLGGEKDPLGAQEKPTRREYLEELANRIVSRLDEHDHDRPRCRPWDYNDFTLRLRTFTALWWFAKPQAVSPLVCARYGWRNTARDELSCEFCAVRLTFPGSNKGSTSFSGSECTSFAARLSSGHDDICPWAGNPCSEDFLKLPTMADEDLRRGLLARFDSLLPLAQAGALPEVALPASFAEYCPGGLERLAAKVRGIKGEVRDKEVANAGVGDASSRGCRGVGSKDSSVQEKGGGKGAVSLLHNLGDDILGKAAAIAVFGWRAVDSIPQMAGSPSPGGGKPRLCCALCDRRLATENFLCLSPAGPTRSGPGNTGADVSSCGTGDKGGSNHNAIISTSDIQNRKRRRLSGDLVKPMDPVAEHRSFCPWAEVQVLLEENKRRKGGEGEGEVWPGWRYSLQSVTRWQGPNGGGVEDSSDKSGDGRESLSLSIKVCVCKGVRQSLNVPAIV